MNLFENAERLLRIAVDTDAWIANRRLNYSSIEGSFPIIGSRAKGAYVWDVPDNEEHRRSRRQENGQERRVRAGCED